MRTLLRAGARMAGVTLGLTLAALFPSAPAHVRARTATTPVDLPGGEASTPAGQPKDGGATSTPALPSSGPQVEHLIDWHTHPSLRAPFTDERMAQLLDQWQEELR